MIFEKFNDDNIAMRLYISYKGDGCILDFHIIEENRVKTIQVIESFIEDVDVMFIDAIKNLVENFNNNVSQYFIDELIHGRGRSQEVKCSVYQKLIMENILRDYIPYIAFTVDDVEMY